MSSRDWSLFKYEIADFLFKKQMDEVYTQGLRAGAEYASRKMSFSIRNLDISKMTKTQRIGYDASLAALIDAKKDVMRDTGADL
tara:strand:+ start:3845 stop:4096 length:252 start_codon:yes stop_codon:yes gene_type:complete